MKNKKYSENRASLSGMEFLGKVEGNGVNYIKQELYQGLREFDCITNAYLSKLKYENEENIRIALVVDISIPAKQIGLKIVERCSEIVEMDIIFFESLPDSLTTYIKENSVPLYDFKNNLYECPIIVERGENRDIPSEWNKAIVVCYVGARDFETALLKAAEELRLAGLIYDTVFQGKVNQIDPSKWWVEIVKHKWKEYEDLFPSQENIESFIWTGGIVKAPIMEY